jgi:hypothetical protein
VETPESVIAVNINYTPGRETLKFHLTVRRVVV